MSIATTRPSEVVLSQSGSKHERNYSQRKKESVTFCLLYKGKTKSGLWKTWELTVSWALGRIQSLHSYP
jgi:hypothetical protein